MRLISTCCRWGLLVAVGWLAGLTPALAQALLPPGLSTDGPVTAWARDGQTLYLAGDFSQIGQYTGNAAMLTPTSAQPDRTLPVILGTINAVEPDGTGGWYLGGSYIRVGRDGIPTNLLHMRADYSVDAAFNANCNGQVLALALNGATLYVGGAYTAISGQNIRNLTAVDATTGAGTGWVPDPDAAVNTLQLQSGTLYVGGDFQNIAGYKRFRYMAAFSTASGAILTTFPGGNGPVNVMLGDSAGGVYAAGNHPYQVLTRSGWYAGGLERVTTTSDAPTFAFPTVEGTINAMISDGAGGWFIGGSIYRVGGVDVGNLFHLTSTGALDAAWNPEPSSTVNALALSGTTLYVGGSFTGLGGQTRYNLGAVSTSTGLAVPGWIADVDGTVNTLTMSGTTLYVGGSFGTIGGQPRTHLAALNTTTAAVSGSWTPDPNSEVNRLLLNGTTLYVGGRFSFIGGQSRTNLASVNTSTGLASTTFAPNPDGYSVTAMALSGTTLYASGSFSQIGGQTRAGLAALSATTGAATAWNPALSQGGYSASVQTLIADATNLYVGGSFTHVGATERQNLAQFTISSGALTTWHPAPDGTVNAIGLNGTAVVFGGSFNYVKSLPRRLILHVNASQVVDAFPGLDNPSPSGYPDQISTLLRAAGRLYVGGSYFKPFGGTLTNLAAINPTTGMLISTFQPQHSVGYPGVYSLCRAGSRLFIGGGFTSFGNQERLNGAAVDLLTGAIDGWDPRANGQVNRIARLGTKLLLGGSFAILQTQYRDRLVAIHLKTSTVTGWRQGMSTGLHPSYNEKINTLVVAGSTIYLGGFFSTFDGVSRTNVASLDKATGALSTWGPIVDGPVNAMIVNGTTVYVGGDFDNAALAPRPNLAAMHYTTGAPVGGFAPAVNSTVTSLVLDGSTLYAGGSFTQIGGLSRSYVAAVSAGTGTGVAGFNATANSTVNALSVVGSTLYTGGSFSQMGGQPRTYAAALNKTTGIATAWNPAPNSTVNKIEADAANVAMSGSFSALGSQLADNFGVVSAAGVPQPFDAQLDGSVSAVLLQQDTLFVSGSFDYVGQQSRYRLARFKLSAAPIGPNIASFSPTSGSVGGTFIITGINFTGATSVLLNGQATTFTVNSATSISVTVPAGATTGALTVTTPNGIAYSLGTFTVAPAPTVSSFSPTSGPVGTDVQIYGSNLTGSTVVRFNGTSTGTFVVNSDNHITATVPAGATTGPISVTAPGGVVTTISSFTVTGLPVITSFSPATGIVGSQVVLTGNYFTGATAVTFNNVNAPAFTVNTVNQITVTVPTGATTGAIRVTTPVGTGVSATNFTVTTVAAPTISSFTPGSGPVGTSVVITGTNLTGASQVTFNNVTAPTYTVNSATQITVTVPTGATTGNIRVQTTGGIATSSSVFLVTVPAPTITSFTPTSGTEGAAVTITGTGFSTASQVTFNGVASAFTASSATSITTSVPVGATTGALTVTNPGGTATSGTSFTVTVPPVAPTIGGFTPTFGPVGTSVGITGTGFSTVTSVAFNGVNAASFSIGSNTQLTAVVAAGTATGPITITNPGGAITSAAAFTVTGGGSAPTITTLSPASGAVGAAVTITGTNFTGATLVKFNGTTATFTVASATSITTTVPTGATTGLVTVTTAAGTATAPVTFTVTGGSPPAPTITSFTPTSGSVGAAVTITGTDFTGATLVKFNGTSATFTVASATSITTTVPTGATTGTLAVTTAGGTATSAASFTVTAGTPAPTIADFTPISGPVGTAVTLTGTGFTGTTGVTINGTAATFTVNSATSISLTVPAGATSGFIVVTAPGGPATSAMQFAVTTAGGPAITSFTPAAGTYQTAAVTITGTGFTGATSVRFNGTAATYTVTNATTITTTVPAGATTGPLTVAAPGGLAAAPTVFNVGPYVSAFSPTSGPVGSIVTITGTSLTGATVVKFNATNAASYTVNSATSITAVVAAGTTTGKVTVTTPSGTRITGSNFTITASPVPTLTSFTPATGPAGTAVTLTGTGLLGASAVRFNGTAAPYSVVSATSITTTVPVGATTGTITVTTPGGTATSGTAFTVTGAAPAGPGLLVDAVTGALPGTQVLVPVRATGFTSLLGVQASLSFDPAVLTLVGTEGFGFADLDATDFGTSQAAAGLLTLAWSSTGNVATSVADNAQLFGVRFLVNAAAASGASAVQLGGSPVALLAVRSDLSTAVPTTTNGSVTVPAAVSLTGAISTGAGAAVNGATVRAIGPGAARPTATTASGAYALGIIGTGAYYVAPTKANDVAVSNGVNVLDMVLMQRHVLGTGLLGTAYKVVAADVDKSGAVTMSDVALVRDLVLGNRTTFPKGRLWQFVRANQTFATPNTPWPVDTARTYASVATASGQDFVACKLGDVNDDWNPAIARPIAPAGQPVSLTLVAPADVAPGQLLTVPVLADERLTLAGLQVALRWDPTVLTLVGTPTAGALAGTAFGLRGAAQGELLAAWTDLAGQPATLARGAVAFTLRFRVVGSAATGTLLELGAGADLAALAVDGRTVTLRPVRSTSAPVQVTDGVTGVGAEAQAAVLRLQPNPASGEVWLSGAPADEAQLLDATGRVVRTVRLHHGQGRLSLDGVASGVYVVRCAGNTRRLVVE